MSLLYWALWGFLGAFVYAAPKLTVAWAEAHTAGRPITRHLVEFAISLTFGPIFAAGFGPFVASYLVRESEHELRAIALVIGMVANPGSSLLVKLVLDRIGGVLKGDTAR